MNSNQILNFLTHCHLITNTNKPACMIPELYPRKNPGWVSKLKILRIVQPFQTSVTIKVVQIGPNMRGPQIELLFYIDGL